MRKQASRAIQQLSRRPMQGSCVTGLIALLAALLTVPANAQTENLRPSDSTLRPLQFIKQPMKTGVAESQSSTSSNVESPLLVQTSSDPKSAEALADLGLPQVQLNVPLADQAIPLGELAVPSAGSASDAVSPLQTSSLLPATNNEQQQTAADSPSKTTLPSFFFAPQLPVQFDGYGHEIPFQGMDFSGPPIVTAPVDPLAETLIYRGKTPIMTQRPWVELGRQLYTSGIYPPANSYFFGETNLLQPHFYVYGDLRSGLAVNQNQLGPAHGWAQRLNLDMDLQFTATERLHAFTGPFDRGNEFTRIDFSNSDNVQYINRTDLRFDTLFFEGDVGAIIGGREGIYSPFDLPFSFGLMPMIYQNGIWMEDAMLGAAFAIPAQHSTLLDWSNYEVSLFALTDQVTSDAFVGDNNAAEVFGTAFFIEAYDGYIEADYAFVHDDVGGHRSYHNASLGFTRRYLSRLSNSVRFLTNFDQALPSDQRTADGYLILLENSLITANANYFVPYANFFYGSGKPQSVARAAVAGGILRNTGINFETDALTGYPTLDPTGNNTYGGALGLNILGNNFSHQLVLEVAARAVTGSPQFRIAQGNQYAAGVRYQKPLSHRWIFRADSMYGWLDDAENIFGNRIEFRWKF